ncbi:uncharacterized protein FOMMEDRAFT_156672 [Fomitiporia mediterranea MF3/22]|uniref:uncharacterized protein n=1 Tax=Fomitiporia mediterranea (strain MF3/22) TaxID=694068 RepID=UPI0004408EE9|nr:uncharacterized protein FOMMEDRAFT_156672 [Fomitiporia mediterranea MF3/22]EJD03285.1 hypothetical protein FOMMEDRAFT_156672 [Fomitiporia mediterranea MF3/22]
MVKNKPFNPTSLIYFTNRYVGLLGVICLIYYDTSFNVNILSLNYSFTAVGRLTGPLTYASKYDIPPEEDWLKILADKTLSICLKVLLAVEACLGLAFLIPADLFEDVTVGILAQSVTYCGISRDPPKVLITISCRVYVANQFVALLLNAAGNPALLCVLGSHLLINLKKAGELGVNEGTNYRSRAVSDIEFAHGGPVAASNEEGTSSV